LVNKRQTLHLQTAATTDCRNTTFRRSHLKLYVQVMKVKLWQHVTVKQKRKENQRGRNREF